MKLVLAGSTGYVATEVLRQALSNSSITSIIALARRPTPVPPNTYPGADLSKLKSVVCEDLGVEYGESIRRELEGAGACIWLIAVTISGHTKIPVEETRKICIDYTARGIKTLSEASRGATDKPLRFIYTSGVSAERNPALARKKWLYPGYCEIRGEAENVVLDGARESNGQIEACITKPGWIASPEKAGPPRALMWMLGLPSVQLRAMAAALLEQAISGVEKETLSNEDLVRIGEKALERQ